MTKKYAALETKNKTLSEQLSKLGEAKPEELQAEISRLKGENKKAEQRYQQALLDHAEVLEVTNNKFTFGVKIWLYNRGRL